MSREKSNMVKFITFRNSLGKEVKFSQKEFDLMFSQVKVGNIINLPKVVTEDDYFQVESE